MKKIENKHTNNTFENIKHIDEHGNEYWYARELSKVLEYRDWRNFLKVLKKQKKLVIILDLMWMNNLLRSTSCQEETIMLLLIYKIINYQDTYAI